VLAIIGAHSLCRRSSDGELTAIAIVPLRPDRIDQQRIRTFATV